LTVEVLSALLSSLPFLASEKGVLDRNPAVGFFFFFVLFCLVLGAQCPSLSSSTGVTAVLLRHYFSFLQNSLTHRSSRLHVFVLRDLAGEISQIDSPFFAGSVGMPPTLFQFHQNPVPFMIVPPSAVRSCTPREFAPDQSFEGIPQSLFALAVSARSTALGFWKHFFIWFCLSQHRLPYTSVISLKMCLPYRRAVVFPCPDLYRRGVLVKSFLSKKATVRYVLPLSSLGAIFHLRPRCLCFHLDGYCIFFRRGFRRSFSPFFPVFSSWLTLDLCAFGPCVHPLARLVLGPLSSRSSGPPVWLDTVASTRVWPRIKKYPFLLALILPSGL